MLRASLTLEPELRSVRSSAGPGSFVEHLGRCVYTEIEPGHATADEDGLRQTSSIWSGRWAWPWCAIPEATSCPATAGRTGSARSSSARPARHRVALTGDERIRNRRVRQVGRQGRCRDDVRANLGTRGVESAVDLLEYCNHPGGTRWSDLRVSHGHPDPFGVKLWCLGNELDGPWQMGHKTAEEYGRLAAETARRCG